MFFRPRKPKDPSEPEIELPKFTGLTFPIVRKVFPQHLVINDLVSVQPMTAPAGSVFYMDYKYSEAAWRKLRKAGIKRK